MPASDSLHIRRCEESDFPQLTFMITSLYKEDTYGEAMTADKIIATVSHFAEHPDKGRVVLVCRGLEVLG